MAEQPVWTDKTKEAVYEYSTKNKPQDLSMEPNVVVKLFYNRGNQQLYFSVAGQEKYVSLKSPKKPNSTPIQRKRDEVQIWTDKNKEAIYEYSTKGEPHNLSLDPYVTVMLFYNRGNQQIQIKEGRMLKTIGLKNPKKPNSTPPINEKLKKS